MNTLLLTLHITTCVILVIVVLLQSGKDGGIGIAGGGGSSQTIFGSSGGANFFTKFTSVAAAIFMLTSIGLTIAKSGKKRSVFEDVKAVNTSTSAPAAPAAAPVMNTTVPDAAPVAKDATQSKSAPVASAPVNKDAVKTEPATTQQKATK